MSFSKELFFNLEAQVWEAGFNSDLERVKNQLQKKEHISADEFANRAIFVILSGDLKQHIAIKLRQEIMSCLQNSVPEAAKTTLISELLNIYKNKNKINAIVDIWQNRENYRNGYYALESKSLETKLSYLFQLPHIGKITKNHLARNLGEDVAKYDIWIQRLGVAFSRRKELESRIDNTKLNPEIVKVCDDMLNFLKQETGLPVGYIDYVLWRACEKGFVEWERFFPVAKVCTVR
jgi:hypothetical protein